MGLIFKDTNDKPLDPKAARLRATLLSLPLALMGLFALVLLVHDGLLGGLDRQHAMGLLSAAIVCGGLIALIFGVTAKKEALRISASKTGNEKPWLKRKDWAEGRVPTSLRNSIMLLWIFVAFWCAASAVISLGIVPRQLQQGNHAALIALVLPLIGLAIVVFALRTTFAWRKFNRSVFEMTVLPGSPGDALVGRIQVPARLRTRHGFHLRLSCLRRATSADRKMSEKILWQEEKWLRADLPQTGSGVTRIPVYFKLPADFPDSTAAIGDGIHWMLESSAELPGPNFRAKFDVPVFKSSETSAASDDPTAQYQLSLDEIWRQIHSTVQVKNLPEGGREFMFPAARNPGFAGGATIICLIWTVIIAVLIWKHAPPPFLLLFGAMDLLMAAFVFDLWFRRSRVVMNSKGLTVQRAWLAFNKNQHIPAGEIKSFASDVGATVGYRHYHDLKVLARDEIEFVLAKHLNSKAETDWLAREMTAALKPHC
jgi:hypothetical protein